MQSHYILPPKELKEILNEIIQYYRTDHTLPEHQAEAPTLSHHLRTGRYYRGTHAHVLNYSITNKLFGTASTDTPEVIQAKQHMIALIERIAIIDPNELDKLADAIKNPNLDLKELLIQSYETLANKKYGALIDAANSYYQEVYNTYGKCDSDEGATYLDIQDYIKFILINNEEKAQQYKQIIIKHYPQIKVGKLTLTAQDYANKLNQHKALLDKQFRDYKIDLNRFVQSATTEKGDRIALSKKSNVTSDYKTYFNSTYVKHEKNAEDTAQIAKKTSERKLKNKIEWIAYAVAFLLGLGEASVAAAGILTLSAFVYSMAPLLAVYLIPCVVVGVLTSGFYANFNLVKQDTYDVLKSILMRDFWVDDNNKKVSGITAICVGVFGIFLAACSGFSYGALSYQSIISNLINHIPWYSACSVGLLVGIPTGVGLAVIFCVAIAGFIKNKGWNRMLDYLNKEFYMTKELRKELSAPDLAKYYFFAMLKIVRLAFVAALTLTIVVAARVVFTQDMANLAGNTVGKLLGWGNFFVMGLFGAQKIQKALGGITPLGVLQSVVEVGLGVIAFPCMLLETAGRVLSMPFISTQELAPVETIRLFGKAVDWLSGEEARPTVCDLKEASTSSTAAKVSISLAAETSAVTSKPLQARNASLQKCVAASRASNQYGEKLGLLLNTGGQMSLFASNPAGYSALSVVGGTAGQQRVAVALAEAAYSQAPNADEIIKVQNKQKIGLPADLPVYRPA